MATTHDTPRSSTAVNNEALATEVYAPMQGDVQREVLVRVSDRLCCADDSKKNKHPNLTVASSPCFPSKTFVCDALHQSNTIAARPAESRRGAVHVVALPFQQPRIRHKSRRRRQLSTTYSTGRDNSSLSSHVPSDHHRT